MSGQRLKFDPYNLIITGVGGQGNVLASRMVGDVLSDQGFDVTIGETFGASQRGGSVMSHVRISRRGSQSPQIPAGQAHMIVSLEPAEAVRVLGSYGNPSVRVITNVRPVYPVGVICGEARYPDRRQIERWLDDLTDRAWIIDATSVAVKMGNPIFSNVVMVGALSGTGDLPLERRAFERVVRRRMTPDKVDINLAAFDTGAAILRGTDGVAAIDMVNEKD